MFEVGAEVGSNKPVQRNWDASLFRHFLDDFLSVSEGELCEKIGIPSFHGTWYLEVRHLKVSSSIPQSTRCYPSRYPVAPFLFLLLDEICTAVHWSRLVDKLWSLHV